MINKTKETYLKYRDRARDLYEHGAVAHGDRFGSNKLLEQVTIPINACVQICEDGAFVDAVVWVPAEKLERTPTEGIIKKISDGVGIPVADLTADPLACLCTGTLVAASHCPLHGEDDGLRLTFDDEHQEAPPDAGDIRRRSYGPQRGVR